MAASDASPDVRAEAARIVQDQHRDGI